MASLPTIQSTTLEGAIAELITQAQALEANPSKNPQNRNLITASTNLDNGTFTAQVNLNVTVGVGTNGSVVVTATSYLTD